MNADGVVDWRDTDAFVAAHGSTGPARLLTWDAENRLTEVRPAAPTAGDQKVVFTYDDAGLD